MDNIDNQFLFKTIGPNAGGWAGRVVKVVIDNLTIEDYNYSLTVEWFNSGTGIPNMDYNKIKNYHDKIRTNKDNFTNPYVIPSSR
jgi:hypothetical protein